MLIEMLAVLDMNTLLWWVDVILKVSIGLGAVVFVHEMGHFLVARACGVKCEKFMVGFDIGGLKLSRRWGETEYGIGIFPLGGYVKMLGQDDDPAHIAEQMRKSEVDAQSTNAVPITGPNGETYYVDRRSYLSKSVPQRMAIISAGVIMNVIFAFIFAVIAYGIGVKYEPSIVSETMPGSPAWRAGIEPGDEIVQIGNVKNPTFMQLRGGVTLGDAENGVRCLVRRAANGEIVELTLKPTQERGRLATIGVVPPQSLELAEYSTGSDEKRVVLEDSPAARAVLVSPADAAIDKEQSRFLKGDRIVRIGDVAVNDYRAFAAELARRPDVPLRITVERQKKAEDDATASNNGSDATSVQELTFEVPPQSQRGFGLVMKMGPVQGIQRDSPAAEAGLAPGQVITTVDDQPLTADRGPSVLPDYFRVAADQERAVVVASQRSVESSGRANLETAKITPHEPTTFNQFVPAGVPMGVPGAGFAYDVENEVIAADPEGPAAQSGIVAGDVIIGAKIIFPKDATGNLQEPVPVQFMTDPPGWLSSLISSLSGAAPESPHRLRNWPCLMAAVQFVPDKTTVEFTVQRGGEEKPRTFTVAPTATDDAYVAARGFIFEPIQETRRASSFGEQVRLGWDETVDALTMVVRFLQKLGTQVPITMLGGPGTIAAVAGSEASKGFSSLLIFLTMLSANLAVINFLPIPLLDGGHMVFLAYEGLRGRPANEKIVVALHTVGFVFIISLMVFVIGLDIQRWVSI